MDKPKQAKGGGYHLAPPSDVMIRDLLTLFWRSFADKLYPDMPEGVHPCNGLRGHPWEYSPMTEKHIPGRL